MPDLITIPGIPELWTQTKGDSRIKIAILDGAADLDRACFQGANISQFKPYWAEDIPLDDEYYHYLKLSTEFNQQQKAKKEDDPDHDKDEAKKEREAFFEQFPEAIRTRIDFSSHATHISSTIIGQHGSPVPGIAPNCTALNIPITFADDNFISFINLTHAINAALNFGANIIHIAACHPTQSGVAQEIFSRAVKQCQDSNVLIVAPGGNDKGECWCIPAILPDVLTVGAMRDDGQPFKFSNYGGDYQHKGVLANGENILGATPGTDEPIREKGTSCAAPIVTGISALLMSLQLQRGEKPNAEAVRQAILKSALPCDPKEVEEPERCLLGKLNISGAYQLIAGENLTQPSQGRQDDSQYPQKVDQHYDWINQNLGDQSGTFQGCLLKGTETLTRPEAYHLTNLYVASQTEIQPGDYVLDAGCGAGGPSIDIVQTIAQVKIAGINLSQAQVNTAIELVQAAGLSDRIHIQVGDYHDLPFADGIFDGVLYLEAIGYTLDFERIFTEAYRVLKPGGTIYIKEIFCKSSSLSPKEKEFLDEFEQAQLYYTPDLYKVAETLQSVGFENIQSRDLSEILVACSEGEDCPFVCGDIKAQKPIALAVIPSSLPLSTIASATTPSALPITPQQSAPGITASAAPKRVYVLGSIGYDFGSEARRDSFKQLMPPVEIEGTTVPANPYDARQLVDYLTANPDESKSLIWTIKQEENPIYAIAVKGGFAADIYETLRLIIEGQLESEDSDNYIERASIPGQLTDKKIQLFSGQEIPVITVVNVRGIYGWKVNGLVDAALQILSSELVDTNEVQLRKSLSSFLKRVYFDLQNLGQTAKDRALNFAATNAFQAASSFAQAVSTGMVLDTIEVEKSPFCRINSDCWDIKLKFFDPDRGRRAKKVYLFTIDVSYLLPVTLGEIRSWSVSK